MKHQNNKLKRTAGRLFLLTMGLFLLTASRGVAQSACPQTDLESQSIITLKFPTIGIGEQTTVVANITNNGPCPIPTGEANAQITLRSDYFNVVPNFTSICAGQWTLLGIVTTGGPGGQHNLFFRNTLGPIPSGGPFCGITIDITGAGITPPLMPGDITLFTSLNSMIATVFDANTTNQFANTQLGVTQFIVPLVLTDFSVTASSCNGIVNWKTVSEDNVDRFEIEFSSNGVLFTNAGTVKAKNSANESVYRYVNAQANGRGYYRLKIIDRDNKFSYSKIISIDTKCNGRKSLSIYPNPVTTTNNLNVIASGYEGSIKGELITVSGQIARTYSLKNGTNTLSVEHLAQSTYMLRVTDASGQAESFRVMIIK